jgi:hypothetical protein
LELLLWFLPPPVMAARKLHNFSYHITIFSNHNKSKLMSYGKVWCGKVSFSVGLLYEGIMFFNTLKASGFQSFCDSEPFNQNKTMLYYRKWMLWIRFTSWNSRNVKLWHCGLVQSSACVIM